MPRLTLPNKALKLQSSKELAKQTANLLNLPWDVQRLIFESVPPNIWRSIPVSCNGFYYSAKSTEVDLLQVYGQINAAASHAMQYGQADQPCVLTLNPFNHWGVTRAILETINIAHTYDETYTKRAPKGQKPALAICPLATELAFQTFDRGITKALGYHLRKKPEVELHLHLPNGGKLLLESEYFDWIGPIIECFVDVVRGNHSEIAGSLRYRCTIVSESEEIQHRLQAQWPQSQFGSAKWEVATKQDREAWDELEGVYNVRYWEDEE